VKESEIALEALLKPFAQRKQKNRREKKLKWEILRGRTERADGTKRRERMASEFSPFISSSSSVFLRTFYGSTTSHWLQRDDPLREQRSKLELRAKEKQR
jgi:hypothetical protein